MQWMTKPSLQQPSKVILKVSFTCVASFLDPSWHLPRTEVPRGRNAWMSSMRSEFQARLMKPERAASTHFSHQTDHASEWATIDSWHLPRFDGGIMDVLDKKRAQWRLETAKTRLIFSSARPNARGDVRWQRPVVQFSQLSLKFQNQLISRDTLILPTTITRLVG